MWRAGVGRTADKLAQRRHRMTSRCNASRKSRPGDNRCRRACRACETVTAEPVPASVIDGELGVPGLHADETPQLDPGAGKTKRAYLWAYRNNDLDTGPPIIVFDYQPNRAGSHV